MQGESSIDNSTSSEHLELFQQVAALFQANAIILDAQAMEYMRPLIEGRVSYEEHRALLEAELSALETQAEAPKP